MFGFLRKLRSNSAINPIRTSNNDVSEQLRILAEKRSKQVGRMPDADQKIQEMIERNNQFLGR